MLTFNLKSKIDDKKEINKYLSKHSYLLEFDKADYCLIINQTHYIYKYQTESNVWYVHHDPTVNVVFRVCVYKL